MSTLAEKWAADSVAHPGMSKDTFVRNELFGRPEFADLIQFLKDEDDLHGTLIESTVICSPGTISEPDPDREGWTRSRIDLSALHVVLRIQIEAVADGRGHILGGQRDYEDRWSDCE